MVRCPLAPRQNTSKKVVSGPLIDLIIMISLMGKAASQVIELTTRPAYHTRDYPRILALPYSQLNPFSRID